MTRFPCSDVMKPIIKQPMEEIDMKRVLITILAMIFLLMLSSCGSEQSNGDNESARINSSTATESLPIESDPSNTTDTSSVETGGANDDEWISISVPPLELDPSDYVYTSAPGSFSPEFAIIDADSIIDNQYPVYINRYAVGHGGPMYDVNDKVIETIKEKGDSFLNMLFNDENGDYQYTTLEWGAKERYRYETDNAFFNFDINLIYATAKDNFQISPDVSDKELLDNHLIKTLMTFCGINSYVIERNYRIGYSSSSVEKGSLVITIMNQENDIQARAINKTSYCIEIHISQTDAITTSIYAYKYHDIDIYGKYETVSYDAALKKLYAEYPELNRDGDIKADIVYNTFICFGYLIPCYRFYIPQGYTDEGEIYYSAADVVMVDLTKEITDSSSNDTEEKPLNFDTVWKQFIQQEVLAPSHANIDPNTEIAEYYPVYKNKYYEDSEGGQRYEFGDTEIGFINDNITDLQKIMQEKGIIGQDFTTSESNVTQNGIEQLINDDIKIIATVNKMNIIFKGKAVDISIPRDELLKNQMVLCAMEYLGISSPKICETISYDVLNNCATECIIKITAESDNPNGAALNNCVSHAEIDILKGSDRFIIRIVDYSGISDVKDCKTISYDAALEILSEQYPDLILDDVKAEIVYNACMISNYIVPCYRFYVPSGNVSDSCEILYHSYDVLMVEFTKEMMQ